MLVASPFRRFVQRIDRFMVRRQPASRRRQRRPSLVSHHLAAIVETLENRQLLSANVIVNSTSGAANYAAGVTISQLNPSVTPVTLRDAVDAVNNTGGSATINFDSTVFGSGQTAITLNGTPLEVTDTTGTVTIQAPTAGQITVSGNNASGVFVVDANSNLELDRLTVTGGMASVGAGINNQGTLTLNSDTITGNNAKGSLALDEGGNCK